ncbi:hypothetical protein RINTHM_3980 [Richelia intracellularis HM01]|uniref:peroxiredoxin-like family protein n=1 Tax=Richelia intracellularis TaxID=1164990 RepID=UPI0002B53691|nr:peroxiredoxin-like family protein [Richelia intracellularis]CCH64868.1 hypothetical protein RINTHM_3980 [Richelia intracellularis HM01]
MNNQIISNSQNTYSFLSRTQCLRVSDGNIKSVLDDCWNAPQLLVIIWSLLGDFDSLEYAWWLHRERKLLSNKGIAVRAIGIGSRDSGLKFCKYTGFAPECLFVEEKAEIHSQLGLYGGLSIQFPLLSVSQKAWLNFLVMCTGIGSPGTMKEVFRGYTGDKKAPQLITDDEFLDFTPLPVIKGSLFNLTGGKGFQRPFELATLRLRNMIHVLSNWNTYMSNISYLVQRGGTFLFDAQGCLIYEHRDRGILGFAEDMGNPLSFLGNY